jgi:tetratricopeptide (TPR) repeat protein
VPKPTCSAGIPQRLFSPKNTLCLGAKIQYNKPVLRPRSIALLLVLGTLAVYLPAARHGFTLYDDGDYVTQNQMIQNGLTWAGVKWAFTTWHAGNWHPLTWLSHMADCQVAGLNPGVPHGVNILLHAANAVLVFALLLRLTRLRADAPARQSGAIWAGAFAAALFAWHPLHVESVAWISERKDVLSTFFALLALLAYTKAVTSDEWRVTGNGGTASPVTRHLSLLPALLFFALGLMTKPMLVTLPFVMLLLDYWPLNRMGSAECGVRNIAKLLLEKIPFFALAAASCVVTFLAQHHGGAVISLEKVSLNYRLENVPVAYAGYLLKTICPAHLAVFYPLNPLNPLALAAAVAALITISWLAWRARRSCPYLLVGWLWFLGTLVPVIGLVQVGGAALADRYSYFPSIGIFLAVALGVRDGVERFQISKPIVGIIAGLTLAACLALTHRQLNFWQDDIALFGHAVAVTTKNDTAHLNLGFALEKIGQKAGAMAEYRAALKLNPNRAETHNNLANLLNDTGHPDEAMAEYQEALRINPNHIASRINYGALLAKLGRFDEAMRQYAGLTRLAPNDWHAPYLTGKALLKQGRDEEAIPYFKHAVALDPDDPNVLTCLAQVLASDENPRVRNGNLALAMAAKANGLAGGNQPAMLDALAMACAELGQFTNAQQTAAYAVKLAAAYEMTNDVDIIGQRLKLYQNLQPFRQSFLFTNEPAKKWSDGALE